MEKDKTTLFKCHKLLQDVLMDAFRTEVLLFEYPYKDLARIDQGFRAMVWKDYDDEANRIKFLEHMNPYRLFVIKSNLGFYNILVFFGIPDKPDFISVGPFRDEELSANYYTRILKDSHLTPTEFQGMKHRYEQMPLADPEVITKLIKHIGGTFFEDFQDVSVEFVEYSEQNREAVVNLDVMKSYSIEFTEKYKAQLFVFLKHIKQGNLPQAKLKLQQFLQESKLLGGKNIRDDKLILHMLNDYCHVALLDTSVHPSHVMNQAFSLKNRIDDTVSFVKLNQLAYDICRKYCLLVRNFANPECSKVTRDVMDYIRLHLDEELSLNYLADIFGKNASALSGTFSKETGISLTGFIRQTRMQEAVRLFNTTGLSVSEVSVVVGYQDFSYFSKIFTKEIGCSPRDYRKSKSTQSL